MNLIASVDKNWGIGYKGQLLCHVPEDMRWFRDNTIGKIVVMGRATLESLPGGRPLADRTNIVLSADNGFFAPGCTLIRTPEELLEHLNQFDSDDIFVIGGASIYSMLLPYCHYAYITKFDREFPADRHLADLDQQPGWKLTSRSETKQYQEMSFCHCIYQNTICPD